MPPDPQSPTVSKGALWASRISSTLIVLFLIMDAVMKFVKPAPVVSAFDHFGLPLRLSVPMGIILLACNFLYAIPVSSILGAIFLTVYLGVLVPLRN